MGKFVISRTTTGFYFDLRAANGKIIAAPQGCGTFAACLAGVESVRQKVSETAGVEEK